MSSDVSGTREGNLETPTRHPLGHDGPEFRDQQALEKEMERISNICHGCRRCDKKRPGDAGAFGGAS